jgi:hypothetical protein
MVSRDVPGEHVGVACRTADSQDRQQEAALEHEAVPVFGYREPVEEAFEQVELEEFLRASSVTLDIYSHPLSDMQEKAAKALEESLD